MNMMGQSLEYATKKLSNNDKLKIAYERKRMGQGFEAVTFL